jgi:hypothetical protein
MKRSVFIPIIVSSIALILTGCTSVLKVAPYPTSGPWGDDVRRLGTVSASSGPWPLSLHSMPPDYTFHAALRAKAASQFGVPESEVVLGEVTVNLGSELDGTIRDWKVTAEAGQRRTPEPTKEKSPSNALIELKKLFDAGAITPDEYDAKKKALLQRL